MDIVNVSLVVTLVLNLLLLLIVGRNIKYSKNSRIFSLVIVTILLWIVTMIFYRIAGDAETTIIWARALYISASLTASSFLFFAFAFSGFSINRRFMLLVFGLNLGIILQLLHPSSSIVSVIIPPLGEKTIVWGNFHFLFAIYILAMYVAVYVILFISVLRKVGSQRTQSMYILVGVFVSSNIAFTTNLVLPSFQNNFMYNWVGQISTVFWVALVTYAIAKHRLLDIRLAVRATIYRLLLVCVLLVGVILVQIIFEYYSYNKINLVGMIPIIVATASVGLFYPLIDKLLRALTDNFLFQREYNRQELLRQLGRGITESIDIEDLKAKIRDTLVQTMRIEKVDFHLSTDQHDYVWNEAVANHELIVYDELGRKIDSLENGPRKTQLERVREQMHNQELAVVMPVVASEGVIGTIVLGEKSGRDAFSSSDLEALETLMFQAGVAIENAQLFSETKQFNRKLQAEVKVATLDLQERNRRLTVLRQLDNIILNTLDVKDMAQKIVDLVSWEMGFAGALMVLREEENHEEYLRATAISSTPIFNKALKILPRNLTDYRIEFGLDPSNLIYKSMKERKPYAATSFRDLYVPPLSLQIADTLQKLTRSEHMVVYPLSVKGRSLGATVFSLPRPYENLSLNDRELIESFMDEAGIAIENAQLYDQLADRNKELQGKNKELEALDRMKDELVSVASHELRTPMTSIKSYLWMALHREDNLSPKLKKYLERAFLSSERMINLVNDMLSASRLEGQRVELKLEAEDVLGHVKAVLDDLRVRAKERGIKLVLRRAKELPLGIIDKERFVEVLYNIIGNAIKYTSEGFVTVDVVRNEFKSIDVLDTNNENGYIWVSIADTGQGIAQEDMTRLFKKFSKLETGSYVKTAETGGTGLGLYISRGLVELHGGSIWVKSKVGEGSTFTFSIPAA